MPLMTKRLAQSAAFETVAQYRAPSGDRQSLVVPPLTDSIQRIRSGKNHQAAGASSAARQDSTRSKLQLGHWPLDRVRALARSEALQAAIRHTSAYRDLWFDQVPYQEQGTSQAWVVAGHQPELFHPGVWFKNFVLSHAANHTGIVPLNLVIDNDSCRAPAISVLTRFGSSSGDVLRTESVMFDAPTPAVAWECRPIVDPSTFDSFPARVQHSLVQDIQQPMVDRLWHHARTAARRTGRLGLAIAEARHALEGELGLRTLELPLSQLCQQESFARFSLEILRNLPRFQQIYNAQRAAYRVVNHIRSESHPVPALSTRHGWLEAPWWVYRSDNPTRKRLFAKLQGNDLLLSDQAGWQATIEGPLDEEDAVAQWQEFATDGVLLRPRALITTMFVRLVVSDLFMHGIGGGKYDQMTDAIIEDYFDIEPPAMCVATATMHLPLQQRSLRGTLADNDAAVHRELETMRRLRYHAEEHVSNPDEETQRLLQAKRDLMRAIPPRGEKWQWHRQITQVNQRLAQLNQASIQSCEARLQELAIEERQLKLARSREFSFCLFELPYVADALKKLAAAEFEPPVAK